MWIAMHSQISGGRADGTQWPYPHTPFEVPDHEGEDLVRGGLGYPVEPVMRAVPEPVQPVQPATQEAVPEPVQPATQETVPEPRGTVFREGQEPEALGYPEDQSRAFGQVPEGTTIPDMDGQVAGVPKPADPKQAWVDYAVAQGRPVDAANAMTKADLMSQYGGRL